MRNEIVKRRLGEMETLRDLSITHPERLHAAQGHAQYIRLGFDVAFSWKELP
jgi:hypothetical protein